MTGFNRYYRAFLLCVLTLGPQCAFKFCDPDYAHCELCPNGASSFGFLIGVLFRLPHWPPHCASLFCTLTVSLLWVLILRPHCVSSLCVLILQAHRVFLLCVLIVRPHFAYSQSVLIVRRHCASSSCVLVLCANFASSLCV